MFGVETGHLVPFVGLARHTKKTMHFMEVFRERDFVRHVPGGLLLSLYNASIIVVAVFAISSLV
jgi:hypothetical protein